jgi:hypothetical protein
MQLSWAARTWLPPVREARTWRCSSARSSPPSSEGSGRGTCPVKPTTSNAGRCRRTPEATPSEVPPRTNRFNRAALTASQHVPARRNGFLWQRSLRRPCRQQIRDQRRQRRRRRGEQRTAIDLLCTPCGVRPRWSGRARPCIRAAYSRLCARTRCAALQHGVLCCNMYACSPICARARVKWCGKAR